LARIIIVDDDELFCDVAGDMLAAAGHMVSAIHNGERAIAAIVESQPDVLILDYNLPGISGLEILRQIRGNASTCDVPVMMLTREDGRLMKARADHDGADEYLVKPCAPDALLRHVEALLIGRSIVNTASASPA
jgi:DNA-binding response OmpR family regulator